MSMKRKRSAEKDAGAGAGFGSSVAAAAVLGGGKVPKKRAERIKCPYLDTVKRQVLDFDFEKLCSVCLSNQNVYCCLVCGQFFQGRGSHTHAYTHANQQLHFVFINLHNSKVYCLPDNYEVIDSALDDVKYALRPTFTRHEIRTLPFNTTLARDVFGVSYLPGFVGLNNLKPTDYVSVVLQVLCHVTPVREFFLGHENYRDCKSALVHKYGELLCKQWSSRNFKSSISPHEVIQEISTASGKRFHIGKPGVCIDFFSWFLNRLHQDLGGTGQSGSSVIHEAFQGEIEITSIVEEGGTKDDSKDGKDGGGDDEDDDDEEETGGDTGTGAGKKKKDPSATGHSSEVTTRTPFLFISLELPAAPLFKDSHDGKTIIPVIPLFDVLKKLDGKTTTETLNHLGEVTRRRYRITKLPRYLVFNLKRFTKNNWFKEKNPTVVNFPVKNLEMKDYLGGTEEEKEEEAALALPEDEALTSMGVKALKATWTAIEAHRVRRQERAAEQARRRAGGGKKTKGKKKKKKKKKTPATEGTGAGTARAGGAADGSGARALPILPLEKHELVAQVAQMVRAERRRREAASITKYDLLANICHDVPAGQSTESTRQGLDPHDKGTYRVHVQNKASDQWYEIQDLHVTETMPQLIGLSESYMMIYERQDPYAREVEEDGDA